MPVTRPPLDSQVTEDSCEPREGGRPGGKKSVKVERKKTDGERRGDAINSFIPRNGRAYLYLTSVKRTCVKYAPNQFPPRGCRPRYFPLSVGRSWQLLLARDYFSFPPPTPLSLFLLIGSPPHLRPLLASSFHPSKDFSPSPPRVRFSLSSFFFLLSFFSGLFLLSLENRCPLEATILFVLQASNTRQNKQRKGGTAERGSVIDALFHLHPSTDSYLRIWILWEGKPRGFYRRARREERALRRSSTILSPSPLDLARRNTRHLFRVFFLVLFFPFSFSFFVKSIRCRSYSSSFLLNGKEIAVRESKKLFFFFLI